jgi:hypothetical protein
MLLVVFLLVLASGCSRITTPFNKEIPKAQGPPARPVHNLAPLKSLLRAMSCAREEQKKIRERKFPAYVYAVSQVMNRTKTVKYTDDGTGDFLASDPAQMVSDALVLLGVVSNERLDTKIAEWEQIASQKRMVQGGRLTLKTSQGGKTRAIYAPGVITQLPLVDYYFTGGFLGLNFDGGGEVTGGIAASAATYGQARLNLYSSLRLVRKYDGRPIGMVSLTKEVVSEETNIWFVRFFGIWIPKFSAGQIKREDLVLVQLIVSYYETYLLVTRANSITSCDQYIDPEITAKLEPEDFVVDLPIRLPNGKLGPGSVHAVNQDWGKGLKVRQVSDGGKSKTAKTMPSLAKRNAAALRIHEARLMSLENVMVPGVVATIREDVKALLKSGSPIVPIPVPFGNKSTDCCNTEQLWQIVAARMVMESGKYNAEVIGALCKDRVGKKRGDYLRRGRVAAVVEALADPRLPGKPVQVPEDKQRNATPAMEKKLHKNPRWHTQGVAIIRLVRR